MSAELSQSLPEGVSQDVFNHVMAMTNSKNIPFANHTTLALCLMRELTARWEAMPEPTRATLLGVAVGLIRLQAVEDLESALIGEEAGHA